MNTREKAFCEFYVASGNATEAAKKAGYSERTAYSQGSRLLRKEELAYYIRDLQQQLASERIAEAQEIRETWSSFMRNPRLRPRDRMRAGELLIKTGGDLLPEENTEDAAETEAPKAVIYLPVMDGESDITAIELPTGEIIPLAGHEQDDVLIYAKFIPRPVSNLEVAEEDEELDTYQLEGGKKEDVTEIPN